MANETRVTHLDVEVLYTPSADATVRVTHMQLEVLKSIPIPVVPAILLPNMGPGS